MGRPLYLGEGKCNYFQIRPKLGMRDDTKCFFFLYSLILKDKLRNNDLYNNCIKLG